MRAQDYKSFWAPLWIFYLTVNFRFVTLVAYGDPALISQSVAFSTESLLAAVNLDAPFWAILVIKRPSHLGPILVKLGQQSGSLGLDFGRLGTILGHLGQRKGHFGTFLGHLGAILGHLGAILDRGKPVLEP